MTQKEKLLALLDDFGLAPQLEAISEDTSIIRLAAKIDGVVGYTGMVCEFAFNKAGDFIDVGIWE